MTTDAYRDVLAAEGFEQIASIDCEFQVTFWWHAKHRLEVSLVQVGRWALVRAVKHYRMTAMGEEGELYTRDLSAFQEYLHSLFEEVHVWCSTFRDITPTLTQRRIREKRFRRVGGDQAASSEELMEQYNDLTQELASAQEELRRYADLHRLGGGGSDLTQRYLSGRVQHGRRKMERTRAEARTTRDRLAAQTHLEREYLRKGEATCLLFTCCSNMQVVEGRDDLVDALRSVVKELRDVHNYQIKQKLGGKLQIYIDELDQPGVALLTRWAGAALCPRQLAKLGPGFEPLREAVERQFMVLPRTDVLLGGCVQDEKKLVGGHVVRDFLQRLERVDGAPNERANAPKSKTPAWIGHACRGGNRREVWELPLESMGHTYISGATGSGKSYLGRTLVEACAGYERVNIVILDPRNQAAGLLSPEDRPGVLRLYKQFGLDPSQARAFTFTYHGLASGVGEPLPDNLRRLAKGRRIISFRGLDDRTRCELAADILNSLFEACTGSESQGIRLVIVIEEAQLFTKKGADREVREATLRSELAIDRIAREGRKYGIRLLILSQSIKDFSFSAAAVRQNISTRIFMQNSDTELEYAAGFLGGDGNKLLHLQPGEAFACNPAWGTQRIAVRPPLSKVWEYSDAATAKLAGTGQPTGATLSRQAQAVVDLALKHHQETGTPAKLADVLRQLQISSRRQRDRIVDELRQALAVRLEHLSEQGQPLVIVPATTQPTRAQSAQEAGHKP